MPSTSNALAPRKNQWTVAFICSVAVLLYDAAGTLVARITGIPDASFAASAIVVYLAIGLYAFRQTQSLKGVCVVALIASTVENTIRWTIVAVIGAGKPQNMHLGMFVSSAAFGIIVQTTIAMAGAFIARLITWRR